MTFGRKTTLETQGRDVRLLVESVLVGTGVESTHRGPSGRVVSGTSSKVHGPEVTDKVSGGRLHLLKSLFHGPWGLVIRSRVHGGPFTVVGGVLVPPQIEDFVRGDPFTTERSFRSAGEPTTYLGVQDGVLSTSALKGGQETERRTDPVSTHGVGPSVCLNLKIPVSVGRTLPHPTPDPSHNPGALPLLL